MRQLFIILAFIFAMPALCFGRNLKIEETQFDLKNSTSASGFYIKGTVNGYEDSPQSNPLEGVKINIEDNTNQYKNSAITDKEGEFEFENLTPGDYLLTFQKEGYFDYKLKRLLRFASVSYGVIDMYPEDHILMFYNNRILGIIGKYSEADEMHNGVRNVKVIVKKIGGKIKQHDKTTRYGMFSLGGIKAGKYKLIMKKFKKVQKLDFELEDHMIFAPDVEW